MAIEKVVGWETGSDLEGTGIALGASVQSTIKRTGTYALRINSVAQASRIALGIGSADVSFPDGTTHYVTLYFRVATLPGVASEFVSWGTATTRLVSARIDDSGQIVLWNGTTSSAVVATVTADGLWHRLDMKVIDGGTCELSIDGSAFQTLAGNNVATFFCYIGARLTNVTYDIYYDDIVIDDAAFTTNPSVYLLKPNGNSGTDNTGFADGTGTSYTEVDEVPHDSDTTRWRDTVNSATPQARGVTLQSIADVGATGNIIALTAIAYFKSSAANLLYGLRVRSGGSVSDGPTTNANRANYISRYHTTINDPATGVAWTQSGIDAAEIAFTRSQQVAAATDISVTFLGALLLTSGVSQEDLTPSESLTPRVDETIAIQEARASTETLSPRVDDAISSLVEAATPVESFPVLLTEALATADVSTVSEVVSPRLDDSIDVLELAAVAESLPILLTEGPRTNLIPNGGFEVDVSLWTVATATLTRITTDAASGAASGEVVTAGASRGFRSTSGITISPLTAYTLSAKIKAPLGKSIRVRFRETGVVTDTDVVHVGTGNWESVAVSVTTLSTTVGMQAQFLQHLTADGEFTWLIDSIQLEAGSFPTPYIETIGAPATSPLVVDFETVELTDSLPLLVTETSDVQEFELVVLTETLSILLTEIAAYDNVATDETLSPRIDDTIEGADTVLASDTLSPLLDDSLAVLEPAETVESFPLKLTEIAALQEGSFVIETFPIQIVDAISIADTAALVETLLIKLTEVASPNELLTETLRPRIDESASLVDVTAEVDVPGNRVWAIIYNSSNVAVGILPRIFEAWTEEAVNEVGRFELIISGTDPAIPLLVEGTQLGIWSEPEGEVMFGRVEQLALVNSNDEPRLAVRGMSVAVELLWEWLFDGKTLDNVTPSAALTAILRAGWTNLVTGAGFQNVTNRYHTMNAWRASSLIADSQSGYIRETYVRRQLELKRGTTDSGIVLTNLDQVNPYKLATSTRFGIVSGVPLYQRDGSQIINRVSARTTREDQGDITLQESTRISPYTIQSVFVNPPRLVDSFQSHVTADYAREISINPQGQNRLVMLFIEMPYNIGGVDEPTALSVLEAEITLGGQLMQKLQSANVTSRGFIWGHYYLINPPTGPQTLKLRYKAGSDDATLSISRVQLLAFEDVDQGPLTAFRDWDQHTGTGSSVSRVVTTAVNDLVVDGLFVSDTAAIAEGAGQTELLTPGAVAYDSTIGVSTKPGAVTSTTMSWSIGTSGDEWWHQIVVLKPALTYYIEDTTSQTAHETRSTGINLNQMSTVVGRVAVANMLYDQAVDYLNKYKDPLETFEIDVASLPLPTTWLVGDSMRFLYRGRARGDAVWLDKDVSFPTLKRRRQWDEAGILNWKLTLGNVYRNPADLTTYVETSKSRLDDIRA